MDALSHEAYSLTFFSAKNRALVSIFRALCTSEREKPVDHVRVGGAYVRAV